MVRVGGRGHRQTDGGRRPGTGPPSCIARPAPTAGASGGPLCPAADPAPGGGPAGGAALRGRHRARWRGGPEAGEAEEEGWGERGAGPEPWGGEGRPGQRWVWGRLVKARHRGKWSCPPLFPGVVLQETDLGEALGSGTLPAPR